MPDYRETIIRIDHGAKTVQIWTEDPSVLRKLDKSKAPLAESQGGRNWRNCPLERFRWKIIGQIQRRPATEAQLAALAKARQGRKVANG